MIKYHKMIFAAVVLLGSPSFFSPLKADEAVMPGQLHATSVVTSDSSSIKVTLDFAKVVSFSEPVRTIIIGNPGIVDGTLSDESTLVLTGKAVGLTNLIVLGEEGREIINVKVHVMANGGQVTTIHHGLTQHFYSCVDTCRPIGKPEPEKK